MMEQFTVIPRQDAHSEFGPKLWLSSVARIDHQSDNQHWCLVLEVGSRRILRQ